MSVRFARMCSVRGALFLSLFVSPFGIRTIEVGRNKRSAVFGSSGNIASNDILMPFRPDNGQTRTAFSDLREPIMAVPNRHAKKIMERVLNGMNPEDLATHYGPLDPKTHPLPPRVPGSGDHSTAALERRRAMLREQGVELQQLSGEGNEITAEETRREH